MTKCDNKKKAIKLKVVHAGTKPACVESGTAFCRGCPGWPAMKKAVAEDGAPWAEYPIHCSVTGLTVCVDKDK